MTPGPPPAKSNAIWWILGVAFGGLILLIFFATAFGLFVAKSLRVRETGNRVEINTPVGQLQVNKESTPATGLPVYPDAKPTRSDEGASVAFIPARGSRLAVSAGKYFTPDPMNKVVAWYAGRLGPEFKRESPRDMVLRVHGVRVVESSDADVAFVDHQFDFVRLVALKNLADGVEISLARFGKQEAQ